MLQFQAISSIITVTGPAEQAAGASSSTTIVTF